MKKITLILSGLLLVVVSFAQDIVISFTGVNANGGYQRLDSVVIHNYSQGWERTAVYPDTTMIARITDIENHSIDNYMLSSNVPNPFDGKTEFELSVHEVGNVLVSVCDMAGRNYASFDGNLDAGIHRFEVVLSEPKVYVLSAIVNGMTSSIKMVNLGHGNANAIVHKGYSAESKIVVSGDFNLNDVMKYIGYATYNGVLHTSTPVTKVQTGSENISLEFDIVDCSTPSLTEINVERCVAYTWGGETYTESGDYVQTLQDVNGCDSVVLLHLTITNNGIPVYSEVEINTCADPFVYNGVTYTESGGYQQVLTAANGCDSIVLLWLHLGSGVYDERDGNSYCSIMIGEQEWLAENMRYLPSVNFYSDASVVDAKYYVYGYDGEDVEAAKENPNYAEYGAWYNWKAALTACPAGWHLPSDDEWTELEVYLQNNGYNFDDYIDTDSDRETHNVIAKSLASTSGWVESDVENSPGWLQPKNNTSSFNGKPAGHRWVDSQFMGIGLYGFWWSSTTQSGDNNSAWDRKIHNDSVAMGKTRNSKTLGFSVRCLRN
ncbi:MAG: fibrobacter succinogenes major paralogous domain-containing protein [Bacteroidales bacterium]|nr:fibrobacter succinogenes major paralogous domain-containing protein [Bacteroidales bacterium]